VLVTSYSPLTVYVNRSGFARFTNFRYDNDNLSALEIHLTNVAIQKNTEEYCESKGGKWFLQRLRLYLNSKFGLARVEGLFNRLQDLVMRTLDCASKLITPDKRCF
jgi:tubulin polyglutamylase TTLL9